MEIPKEIWIDWAYDRPVVFTKEPPSSPWIGPADQLTKKYVLKERESE